MPPDLTERRVALAVIVAATAVFVALLVVTPAFYPTFDEWKYFGIGYNFWGGHGITTVFGGEFLLHGPIWSIVVTAPNVFFGWDTPTWGHLLDGICGTAIVVLGAWFGWRIRPAAGALAAIGLVGALYLHDQTRTARLDVPAAAFALLFVALGFEAFRRGSIRWAIGAGVVFAIGFLIKEIDLPFAPVPFLAAVAWNRPWVSLGRVLGWMLLVSAVGISWWFVLFARDTGRFYRLDTPAWTLIPVAIGVAIVVVVGIGAPRLAATERARRLAASPRAPTLERRARLIVALGGTLAWSGLQLLAYSKTARLKGEFILSPRELALYAREWLLPYWALVAIAGIGLLLAVVAWFAYRDSDRRSPMTDLFITAICGLPLVLLVVGVGEPPRNYIAQAALAAGLVAAGLLWGLEEFLAARRSWFTVAGGIAGGAAAGVALEFVLHRRPLIFGALLGAIAGLGVAFVPLIASRRRPIRWREAPTLALAAVLAIGLVGSAATLGVHATTTKSGITAGARADAIRTADDWIRANVAPGTTIAFGSFLGYEMGLSLVDRYTVVSLRHRQAVSSPTAPEGMLRVGETPADDWVSVDIAPRNVNEFQAFRADWLTSTIRKRNITMWVYSVGEETSAPTVLAAATPANGFDQLAHWTFPVQGRDRPLETYVFAVNPAAVTFDPNMLFISPEALDRLIELLGRNPAAARGAATTLEQRVRIIPSSPSDTDLLARLHRLATGS